MQRVLEAHFSFQRTSDPLVPLPARGLFHSRQAHVGYRLMMTDHPENYLRISNALFAHCFVQIGPWVPETHRCVAEEINKLTISSKRTIREPVFRRFTERKFRRPYRCTV